jgi:hypothetical protein
MIYASKSLRRSLDLGIKIKHASVYRLRHKIDGWRMARETRRASRARVSQSSFKTGGGATMSGTRDIIAEVTSRGN